MIIITVYGSLNDYLKFNFLLATLVIIATLIYSNLKKLEYKSKRELEILSLLKEKEEEIGNFERDIKRFLFVLNNVKEGIIVIDKKDSKIVLGNNSFNKITSFHTNVKGREYWEVIKEANVLNAIEKVILSDQPSEIEVSPMLATQASHFYNVISYENYIVITLEDMSYIKRLERIRTDFVSNVSHELKNPLTAILGFLEILEDEELDELERRKYTQIVHRNVQRLIEMVENLLFLSKIENRDKVLKSIVSIEGLIDETVELYRQKIERKNIELIVKISPDLNPVYVNSFQLKQVFINLLDNAIKYTFNGGKIVIKAYNKEDYLRIDFCDNGIGIPFTERERIFERFYKIDKSRQKGEDGVGLGLSIVRHIIESIGGKIEIESVLGKGSIFSVLIPCYLTQS